MSTDREPGQVTARWAALVGGALFVALAVWLVPWDPIPGGPLEPVPATDVLTPEQIERAEQFSRWARVWSYGSLAVSLAFVCFLGFSRHGQRLVQRLPGPWWAQTLLAVAAVELLRRLVTLPFAVAQRQHRLDYGLSTQSWDGFAVDLAKSEALSIMVTGVALVVVLAVARRWRRAWPAVVGGLLGAFVLVASFGYPLLVEPIFNDFDSLPGGELRTAVLEVAEAEGVALDDVLVVDASRRTTTLNAYVSGFGNTRRVVLYDTLVDDLPADQALSVVAHELAHAKHQDVVVGSVLGAAGVVAAAGLLALVVLGAQRRRPAPMGPAVVPLLLALFAVGSLLAAPIENGISRRIELRADVEALRVTQDPEAFVAVQRRLAQRSLADPTPPALLHWWFSSHPSSRSRLGLVKAMCGVRAMAGVKPPDDQGLSTTPPCSSLVLVSSKAPPT
ncbi:M48 family metallopeptidase [Nocardioides ferulae]|uniref:M48 family metallopeptidase n=1 Tax=Nocardioides ferulae TaxID=2340821 RepID=UPI000EB4F91D|nr:M48 family metallopeptidase [Nocardioides ferulae]